MKGRGQALARALTELSDRELLALAGSRPDAFAVFYRRYAESVFRFFRSRTACRETAADLTAETFAQAFLSRRRYQPGPAPARAWLYAIAEHELAHFLRSASVAARARRRLGIGPLQVGEDAFDRIEDLADLANHRAAIQDAVAHLSTPIGDAVRFRVLEELPYADVAERLGCSPATARQRVARGLRQLADQLEVLT